MSVFHQDVLEDLYTTNMLMQTARLQRQSDVYCYQSTQVSRADVPDGTVVIQPDFPLSPLHCAAAVVSVSSDCDSVLMSPMIYSAGRLCTKAQTVTVTAVQARPTVNVVDSTEAYDGLPVISSISSDVSLPSVVYNRVRDLFCTSGSELSPNRLLDTLSNSTASDDRQQNGHDDELVPRAGEIFCTTAISGSSDPSPLDSSYVDAGRMAYSGSDVNSLSIAVVVSAADMPVMTTCVENVENNMGELCIANVYSLHNNVDMAASSEVLQSVQSLCQETYTDNTLSYNDAKNSQLRGHSPITKEKLSSPESNSVHLHPLPGSKRKRSSLHKETVQKSDVLFKKTYKTKCGSRKRRLYKHNMLTENNVVDEQSLDIDTNVRANTYSDGVDKHMHRQTKCDKLVRNDTLPNREVVQSSDEIPSPATTLVPAAVSLPTSQISNDTAVAYVNDIRELCRNLVEVTAVESDTKQLATSNKTGLNISLQESIPAAVVDECSHILLEREIQEMQHDTAVSGTDHMTDTDSNLASVMSPPIPNNGLCIVTGSVTSSSVPNQNSVECPRSLNNQCNSQILSEDGRSTDCMNGELLDGIKHTANVAAVENAQTEVAFINPPLCETDRNQTDSAVKEHILNVETSSELLSSVTAESDHIPLVRHDDNTQAHNSPQHLTQSAADINTRNNNRESSEKPATVSSAANRHNPRIDRADINTDVPNGSPDQSKSHKEIDCHTYGDTTDLKSVSFTSAPCNNAANESRTIRDCDTEWYSQTAERKLMCKKLKRRTTVTSRARTSSANNNRNIVAVSCDMNDQYRLTSDVHNEEKTSSTTVLCIPSEITNEGSSPSLLCGQKQSGESYCLPEVTASMCRLSAVGTPLTPSHSCSLQCRGRCSIAEESLGYCQPATKPDGGESGGSSDHLIQSERRSTSDLIASFKSNTSSARSTEQSSRVVPAFSVSSTVLVCASADAAVTSDAVTESKQSSSVPSGSTSKSTLPTPKNSLTCYQPTKNSSAAAASSSSLATTASQVQPNYGLIQVSFLGYFIIFMYRVSKKGDTKLNQILTNF